jgi:hypothetical protein
MKTKPCFSFILGVALLALIGFGNKVSGQGCMQCRYMALSFGPDGVTELRPGQWQTELSFRYLYADEGWRGTNRWPEYATVVGNQITVRSFDLQLTHALTRRLTMTLSIPYSDSHASDTGSSYDHARHAVRVRGVGDLRMVANMWLFDSNPNRNGNLSFGVGVKAPTGKSAATGLFFKQPTGPEVRPVDSSLQPGDGGWGVVFETSGYRRLTGQIFGYANGYYLINPRETNSAYTTAPILGAVRPQSVSDQYQARAGLSTVIWPVPGLTVSFGGRINGMPSRDLVGGSEGYRRPGFVIYLEPGLSWSHGKNSFSLFVPSRLDANRIRNVYEKRAGVDGGGAFARRLWVASYAHAY